MLSNVHRVRRVCVFSSGEHPVQSQCFFSLCTLLLVNQAHLIIDCKLNFQNESLRTCWNGRLRYHIPTCYCSNTCNENTSYGSV